MGTAGGDRAGEKDFLKHESSKRVSAMQEELKEAMLYERMDGSLRCRLCSHYCVIAEGKLGVCRVRENREGKLYTLVYGRTISQSVDPVEKKPLYHFYPGSNAYSIATPGCNFRCPWCQNWQISQMPRRGDLMGGYKAPPQQIVDKARASGCRSIAYTYTEPTIFFEYTLDIAKLAQRAGIANIYVTNGYMTPEMLQILHPYLDAANVDLKAFRKRTYQRYIGASLQPILENMKLMKKYGVWLEVTTLVVPDLNDDPVELRDAAQFIASELGPETPWHISRFFPGYEMPDRPATPLRTLQQARDIGLDAGLRYVYLGNVGRESDTLCHHCGQMLVRRQGYGWIHSQIENGGCPNCGTPAAGVWE